MAFPFLPDDLLQSGVRRAGPPPMDSLTSPSTSLRRPTSWQSRRRRHQWPQRLWSSQQLMSPRLLERPPSTGSQPATRLQSRTRVDAVSCPCNKLLMECMLPSFPELVLPFSSHSGSCWAFAATEVIESMYLIKVSRKTNSHLQPILTPACEAQCPLPFCRRHPSHWPLT